MWNWRGEGTGGVPQHGHKEEGSGQYDAPTMGGYLFCKGYLFTVFILQSIFMMLFILVMYSVKPLPVPWAAFKEVGKQIPTPFVQRGENTGGNRAAISKIQTHLQAITLPMEGKYELRVGFLIYFF